MREVLTLQKITVRDVLTDLSFTVGESEWVLVVGDNGAGKTTLFNTILGNILPDRGKVLIEGSDVTSLPPHSRASVMAHVFQDPTAGTVGHMTIRENLRLASRRGKKRSYLRFPSRKRDEAYREQLSALRMNLEDRLDDYAGDLSGGQRQALSIVLSLLTESKIWLLDEITAALDQKTSATILEVVRNTLRQRKQTCLMITHNPQHIGQLGDRVLILKDGRVHEQDLR
ncbi:MAG: ATP-binding cassette domain-containing protein [Holosporales bacterium]|jgi:putative ABC transport system ATP-binding protein|nr:ATP-binding cassette domain-containing protein [Holosporales bacterium]